MYEKKAHVILNVLPKHLQNNESESFALLPLFIFHSSYIRYKDYRGFCRVPGLMGEMMENW